jgi:hypothetical protein
LRRGPLLSCGGICARLCGAYGVSGPERASHGGSQARPQALDAAARRQAPQTALAAPRRRLQSPWEACPLTQRGNWASPRPPRGGRERPLRVLHALAVRGRSHVMTWGPQMTCLAAWPAGLGASTLAPHARHRTVTKAAVGLGGGLRPAARRARGHSPIYRPPGLLGAPTAASRGRTHTRRQPTGRPAARAPVARCARRA